MKRFSGLILVALLTLAGLVLLTAGMVMLGDVTAVDDEEPQILWIPG